MPATNRQTINLLTDIPKSRFLKFLLECVGYSRIFLSFHHATKSSPPLLQRMLIGQSTGIRLRKVMKLSELRPSSAFQKPSYICNISRPPVFPDSWPDKPRMDKVKRDVRLKYF